MKYAANDDPEVTLTKTPTRSFATLKRRLSDAGFAGKFLEKNLLPDWWSDDCTRDPQMLSLVEFEVARFLATPIDTVRDPLARLTIPEPRALLRAPRNQDKARLCAAIHFGQSVANAVVRSLSPDTPPYRPLPSNSRELRDTVTEGRKPVSLTTLLETLWAHGIPVASVKTLPSPKFKAMACFAEGRPVILIGTQDSDHPKALTNLAHETGHVALGHVTENSSTVEGDESDTTGDDLERDAWAYSHTLLMGDARFEPARDIPGDDPDSVKKSVIDFGAANLIDPALLAHRWGVSRNHKTRKTVLRQLRQFTGAQELIQEKTLSYLDVDSASESDSNRLRSLIPEL